MEPASAPDPAVSEATKAAHAATVAWVEEVVGSTTGPFFGASSGARLVDSALADLINAVQIEVSKEAGFEVDISASAVLSNDGLPVGNLRRKDIFTIYPFENSLCVVEISSETLTEALVINARYFPTLDAAALPASPSGYKTTVQGYNYDFYTRVAYSYDVTKENPARLVSLTLDGAPLATRTFKVAVNSFRCKGQGNAAFAKGKVVWDPKTMREYLLEYVATHKSLSPDAINTCNFSMTPDLYGLWYKATQPTKCAP